MDMKELIEATCPECRGPLSQICHDDAVYEYSCLVGHAYAARTLLQAHSDVQEQALWSAVLALEESANIVRAVSVELAGDVAERLAIQANLKIQQAAAIREILQRLEPFQTG